MGVVERMFYVKLPSITVSEDISIYENAEDGLLHIMCDDVDIPLSPTHCELIADALVRSQDKHTPRYPSMETSAFFAFDKNLNNRTIAVRISVAALNIESSMFKILVSLDDSTNLIIGAAIYTCDAMESLTMTVLEHRQMNFLPSDIPN